MRRQIVVLSKAALVKVRSKADEQELPAALQEAIDSLGGLKNICKPDDRVLRDPPIASFHE
jgi:hypothetical protein